MRRAGSATVPLISCRVQDRLTSKELLCFAPRSAHNSFEMHCVSALCGRVPQGASGSNGLLADVTSSSRQSGTFRVRRRPVRRHWALGQVSCSLSACITLSVRCCTAVRALGQHVRIACNASFASTALVGNSNHLSVHWESFCALPHRAGVRLTRHFKT